MFVVGAEFCARLLSTWGLQLIIHGNVYCSAYIYFYGILSRKSERMCGLAFGVKIQFLGGNLIVLRRHCRFLLIFCLLACYVIFGVAKRPKDVMNSDCRRTRVTLWLRSSQHNFYNFKWVRWKKFSNLKVACGGCRRPSSNVTEPAHNSTEHSPFNEIHKIPISRAGNFF